MAITKSDFADWLQAEISKHEGWNPTNFALKADIGPDVISRTLNAERSPSNETLIKIASALGYSKDFIFRKAGILDPVPEKAEQEELLLGLFSKLPEEEKSDLLTYMQIKLEMLKKSGKI